MRLEPGARLGPYEVLALLGAGGMGEVYRARDTRLDRTVAVKVLPPYFVGNPDMADWFEREARTIASLNHPNICTLHDVGREGEVEYFVMEYVEGETLAARLERGALPIDEALRITVEIAAALDKAHAQGVVHRDLKPLNIMLTKSGTKLLDFGLAKLRAPADAVLGVSMMPTVAAEKTTPGMILGTLQYMAPEQLEGRDADKRADIFALGAVMYEMITGRKAFEGKSRAILMAAILTGEPQALSRTQSMAPPALDHIVKRCLAKDPEDRWQTAHDMAVQLEWIGRSSRIIDVTPLATAGMRARERRLRLGLAAAALLLAALAVPAYLYLRGPAAPAAFQIRIPAAGLDRQGISVSPDGKTIAVVAQPTAGTPASVFVRAAGSVTSLRLAGTDDAEQPFWSPDSRYIGFVAGGRIRRIEATGGAPKQIAEVEDFSGGTWSSDGTIVYGTEGGGLFRVSAEGGSPEPLTKLEKGETAHLWPHFLPDGRGFLSLAWSQEANGRAVYSGSLDSSDRTKVLAEASNAAYADPGYLVFHREATLFAQPFDPKRLALTGTPLHLADEVLFNVNTGRGAFDLSQSGTLLYYQGESQGAANNRGGFTPAGTDQIVQLGWLDRSGKLTSVAGDGGVYGEWDVSPDGKQIAVTKQDSAGADIWVIDWQRAGVETPLTRDPGDDVGPVWSANGEQVAFTTWRKGNADIYVKNANGVGAETPLLETSSHESVEAWSRDGRYIAYKFGQEGVEDIYALPLFGKPEDRKPIPVVQGRFQKDEPQFSPDGKWLAYTSNESGTFQVSVVSFPEPGQKRQISVESGGQPRWSPNGKELFFRPVGSRSAIMAAEIRPGARLEASVPQRLFVPERAGNFAWDPTRHRMSVGPDGRFLVRVGSTTTGSVPQVPNAYTPAGQTGQTAGAGAPSPMSFGLTAVLHWPALLGGEPR